MALQWGSGLATGETLELKLGRCLHGPASMGLRSCDRRNALGCISLMRSALRFNGAPVLRPEKLEQRDAVITAMVMLQWGSGLATGETRRAEASPPRTSRFNGAPVLRPEKLNAPGLLRNLAELLQWGSGLATGETGDDQLLHFALFHASMGLRSCDRRNEPI